MHLSRFIVAALALATFASPAWPHSLEQVDQQLFDKEKYFQPVDSQAPDFTLQNAAGRVIRMRDFRGKVVVPRSDLRSRAPAAMRLSL